MRLLWQLPLFGFLGGAAAGAVVGVVIGLFAQAVGAWAVIGGAVGGGFGLLTSWLEGVRVAGMKLQMAEQSPDLEDE